MYFERSDHWTDSEGVRQQYNLQTAWIDGSHIYGQDTEQVMSLRSMVDGKLLAKEIQGQEYLPGGWIPFSLLLFMSGYFKSIPFCKRNSFFYTK